MLKNPPGPPFRGAEGDERTRLSSKQKKRIPR
jgi:hypothetical protein